MTSTAALVRGLWPNHPNTWRRLLMGLLSAVGVPLALFSVFLAAAGVAPWDAFPAMISSSVGSTYGIGETLLRAAPFVLTALATAIPAKPAC